MIEPASDNTAWRLWRDAARRPLIDRAIRDLYARLDAAVQSRGPTCWISGKCCNFDAHGHRLYVTGLEIAWVLKESAAVSAKHGEVSLTGPCSFQANNLCTVHTIRPLGCRVFFCQQGTQQWQSDLYEQFLGQLRSLHDEHALPYRYMEWRAGLRAARQCAE